MAANKLKITIADDHKMFAKSLANVVNEMDYVEVVAIAYDGAEALRTIISHQPDIAFLDLNMPEKNGLEVLAELKDKGLRTKVLVISMHDGDRYVQEVIELGASGFISKHADPDEIWLAIESIQQNNFYFNESTNKAMLNKMVDSKKLVPVFGNHEVEFTSREKDILILIAKEMTSQEIAAKLDISLKTVETMRKNMFEKVGVRNVVGLALYAQKNGIV